ncbi:MAG: NfeD family protein [Oceanospirillaceae bacterium]
MAILTQNMAESLLIAGLVVLVIEVLVLGFSTFFLFFLGIGLISTGLIFFAGAVEQTAIAALVSVSLISSVAAIILWQPLKKMQNTVEDKQVNSDIIGYRFRLEEALAENSVIVHQYSGISWKISSDQPIALGVEVEVLAVSVGKMKVKRVEEIK